MNESTQKNLMILGFFIALGAFIYVGVSDKKNQDDIIPGDLSMEEKLLLERNQAKEIKEDELTRVVNEKLKAGKQEKDIYSNNTASPKPAVNSKPPAQGNDAACEAIRKAGGTCDSSETSTSNKSQGKREGSKSKEKRYVSYNNSQNLPPEKDAQQDHAVSDSKYSRRSKFFGTVTSVDGASRVSDVRMIKAGCTMLAQLESGVTVTNETRKGVTFLVKGPLFGCQLPEDFSLKLVGTAKLNSIQKGIAIGIDTCTSTHADVKSGKCRAVVQSISPRGGDLEGEIYDQSGWAIFWESVLLIGTAPTLSKLTETASTASNLWAAETARQVSDTLSNALQRVATKISKTFEGREITVGENVFVKVKILEDFVY